MSWVDAVGVGDCSSDNFSFLREIDVRVMSCEEQGRGVEGLSGEKKE